MDLLSLTQSVPHVSLVVTLFIYLEATVMVGNHVMHSSKGMTCLYLGVRKITVRKREVWVDWSETGQEWVFLPRESKTRNYSTN